MPCVPLNQSLRRNTKEDPQQYRVRSLYNVARNMLCLNSVCRRKGEPTQRPEAVEAHFLMGTKTRYIQINTKGR